MFERPPQLPTSDNKTRKVGFELEFSGITLKEAAENVQQSLQGKIEQKSAAEYVVTADGLGEFGIELDWTYLKRKAKEVNADDEDTEWIVHLSRAAAVLVPLEVVCPPIEITSLERLQPMESALRTAGAIGTEESLVAAYGVHVNTEIPSLDADTLFTYIRAFCLLQWWLSDAHQVDVARKFSRYIQLYPKGYVEKVMGKSGSTMDEIFDDYFEYNCSRNRALDLLPLLAEIDADRVKASIDDPRIKARPAFHYRLPNCHIEKTDWSLARAWGLWCVLEKLVAQPEAIDSLATEYLDADKPVLGINRDDWVARMNEWLVDHELV